MKNAAMDRLGISDNEKVQVNYLGGIENLFFKIENLPLDIDVLFFGRVEYYKGLDILVECAKNMPDVKFVIAGRGSLERLYGLSKLPNNCIRIDTYVPDKELASLIMRSKIIVLPYKDATGTQTIQTAFYYGKPVVATKVGCFPEYIYDGEDGILIQPNDVAALKNAINEILSSSTKREAMGKAAQKHLSTVFDNDKICERYCEIFSQLIKHA